MTVGHASRDVARWLLDGPSGKPFENTQTNHIALYTWCAATDGRCDPERYGSWYPADRAAYERERLDLAKSVLGSFLAVGTVERLPETLDMVRRRSAKFGLHLLPVERLAHVIVTSVPFADDISWIDNEPLGRRLLESVAVDRELHAYAQGLLDTSLGKVISQAG